MALCACGETVPMDGMKCWHCAAKATREAIEAEKAAAREKKRGRKR